MSNLYKGHYTVNGPGPYSINSNELVAQRMEELVAELRETEGFREGLAADPRPPQPAIDLQEVRREADSILKAAKIEADRELEEARKQAEALKEASIVKGRQEGYEAGIKQAGEEAETLKQQQEEQFAQRAEALKQEYNELKRALEPQILEAVCQVFEKVFDIQFDRHKEMLLYLVKQAILKIESTKEFHVRVSEENYPYLEEHKAEILNQVGQNIRLEVEADASLDDTQCVMETDSGFFECGIGVQFENLIKAIRSLSV